ncbi:hypothetical protein ACTHAM_001917 [Cellulomonas soli]|uniref:hypothetical protein n=1 Tax=Cellulomonas soli TaxID=931535 RepID=UPI003F8760A0
MTSSSTDVPRWWQAEGGSWLRLAAALLVGLLALLAPAVGTTGAVFVDEAPVTTGVTTAPTFTPAPGP